jgi:hypothetical protein
VNVVFRKSDAAPLATPVWRDGLFIIFVETQIKREQLPPQSSRGVRFLRWVGPAASR